MDILDFFFGQYSQDLAHANHQAAIWNLLALRNDRTRTNQAVFPDFGSVQNDGLHPDQGSCTNRASVQHGLMADRDVLFHD